MGPGAERLDGSATVIQQARLQWLQQAHNNKMKVAELRLAISNEWTLSLNLPPAQPTTDAAPVVPPAPPLPPDKKRTSFPETPVYRLLSAHLKGIQALAHARRITPDMLVADAIAEYLEAHSDELSDAVAKDMEESERKFRDMQSAARRVEQQTRWLFDAYHQRTRLKGGLDSLSRRFPDDEPAFAQVEAPLQEDANDDLGAGVQHLEAA